MEGAEEAPDVVGPVHRLPEEVVLGGEPHRALHVVAGAAVPLVLVATEPRPRLLVCAGDLPGPVGAAVVDDDDLEVVRDLAQAGLRLLDVLAHAGLFVEGPAEHGQAEGQLAAIQLETLRRQLAHSPPIMYMSGHSWKTTRASTLLTKR